MAFPPSYASVNEAHPVRQASVYTPIPSSHHPVIQINENTTENVQETAALEENGSDYSENLDDEIVEFKVHIKYILWVPVTTTSQPRSRKRKSQPASSFSRLMSDPDRFSVVWPVCNKSLTCFKNKVASVIGQEEKVLESQILFQDSLGTIDWMVTVPHSPEFSASHKRRLDGCKTFLNFIQTCQDVQNKKIVCKLIQKDPKLAAAVSVIQTLIHRTNFSSLLMLISSTQIEKRGNQTSEANAWCLFKQQ